MDLLLSDPVRVLLLLLGCAVLWSLVTTAFRQHPGETVWRVVWQLPAIVAFGLPLWVVVLYLTVSAAHVEFDTLRYGLDGIERRASSGLRGLLVMPFAER